jgi:hypothetical protein
MTSQTYYTFALLSMLLGSCIWKSKPNLKVINKDLGITIPKHSLTKADSDPFGLGADSRNTFVFQFDSTEFIGLEKEISHSFLFNVASKSRFDSMALSEKIKILRSLATHGLTGYWIKSGSIYWFDGDSAFSNPQDNVFQYLPSKHIFLPNQDSTSLWKGSAATVYWVKAAVDRKKRTLYYQFVHI